MSQEAVFLEKPKMPNSKGPESFFALCCRFPHASLRESAAEGDSSNGSKAAAP
jgi:hypothetical protein